MTMISPKTKKLISYIIQKCGSTTITSIMKLSYLIDLISVKKTGKQISGFQYERYLFGPFDKGIYIYIQELIKEKTLKERLAFTPGGDEYIVYEPTGKADRETEGLKKTEIALIDSVLGELGGLGAKSLSQIAYATGPMKKLGATMGNRKGLNKLLDLAS